MKASKFILLLTILTVTIFSCKDDNDVPLVAETKAIEVFDTIYPGSYFPAYPGSYWVYDTNDTLKVSSEYKRVITYSGGVIPSHDTAYMTELILNGIFNKEDSTAYVRGYEISKSSFELGNYGSKFKRILSEISESKFSMYYDRIDGPINGFVSKSDTSINVKSVQYSNVLEIIIFRERLSLAPEECGEIREYYAKGVGLIRRDERDYPSSLEYVTTLELVDYVIQQ
jgi:hypothetical protein